MLTELDFKLIEKEASKLYSDLEYDIIKEIAERIANVGYANTVVYNNAVILQEMGVLYEDVINMVAEYNETSASQIRDIFEEAGIKTLKRDDSIYKMAGLNPQGLNNSMQQVLNATVVQTNNHLSNLVRTTASTSQIQFIEAMNTAYMEVSTGVKSYSESIVDIVKKISKNGVYIQYPSGQHRSIESATRMNILTSVNQMSGRLQLLRADEMGWDLMELSAHSGARPEHAEWQGKIVSRSGQAGYLSLDDIGYGTATGFQGVNCRHTWFPYYKGSILTYSNKELRDLKNETVEYNGKKISKYEATQIQRKMERQIRQNKKDIAGLQGILTSSNSDVEIDLVKRNIIDTELKLKEERLLLNDFTNQTKLKNDDLRTFVSKEVTKDRKDDIIIKEIKQITERPNAKVELEFERPKNLDKYEFDYNHINLEREHKVNKSEAIEFINESKVKMTVWQGRYENYYSDNGATYIDTKDKKIRTAFKKGEYDKKITDMMEVINGRT